MVPNFIDIRLAPKQIVASVRNTEVPVVLLPERVLKNTLTNILALDVPPSQRQVHNFDISVDKLNNFFGWKPSQQWDFLEVLGLKDLIMNEAYFSSILKDSEKDSSGNRSMVGIFSSGTTSTPKCIWNRVDRLVKNGQYSADAFEVKASDTLLLMALPWHVAGLTWAFMAEEAQAEYEFLITRSGEEKKWLANIQSYNPSYLCTVPSALSKLYGQAWEVDRVVYGGQPMSEEDYALLSNHCHWTYQGYGQTEAGGLISVHKRWSKQSLSPGESQCQGIPIEGVDIRCEGVEQDPSAIYIRSSTASVEGFYNSGDQGYLNHQGLLYLIPRVAQKNMIG